MYKKALLINQEGKEFTGWTTEDFHPSTGELIFNTAMTGFVEILSDPSYVNQIITFTSSHIGNYGLSKTDFESERPRVNGAIGTSFTTSPSSWRAEQSITSWLKEYEIPYSGGFDVRSITSYLRDVGSSMFAFGTGLNSSELKELLEKSTNIIGDNSALTAGRSKYDTNSTRNKIGILDLGAKQSIIDVIKNFGFECIFVDPKTTAQDIISLELSGLIIRTPKPPQKHWPWSMTGSTFRLDACPICLLSQKAMAPAMISSWLVASMAFLLTQNLLPQRLLKNFAIENTA